MQNGHTVSERWLFAWFVLFTSLATAPQLGSSELIFTLVLEKKAAMGEMGRDGPAVSTDACLAWVFDLSGS